MKLNEILSWLDRTLKVADFADVSNNGLQVARRDGDVQLVAFAVDASLRAVQAAARAGAGLLVVHHGISWGGGIRRLDGGVYAVVKAAMDADLAIYACHLPLDAHPTLGNNAGLAQLLKLKKVRPAFVYNGQLIGFVGICSREQKVALGGKVYEIPKGLIGVCSGGAGDMAEEAKSLGCAAFLTGEASWGQVIAAENVGMRMICAGHYETEVFGVRAVSAALRNETGVSTLDMTEELK